VAIDVLSEETISLAAAARRLPRLRAGRPVSAATVWRWASHGLRGVRLEVARCGGTTVTSPAALRRFFDALGDKPESPIVPASIRDHRAEKVSAELAEIGI
jgi:Protein of unknown function (DUF1580)